ncbi:MAG: UvrD-helicase domain-containing protein [Patescibacteria group bacterium]|nr:UvrD-helicase domain-containing protein [Patescibacteria group bacterium]
MDGLNPEQLKAVNTIDGPVLIIAGAGSGKTRVITHRILNLIRNGVAPHNILAITFTNKAAREMRDRVASLIANDKDLNLPVSMSNSRGERPFVSTFHSLGVQIIRAHAREFGLTRHFTIYDRADSKRAIKEAMEQSSIDPKKFDPGFILNKISLAKGDGIGRLEYFGAAKDFIEEMAAGVWEKYELILAKEKALDFDDLLLKTAQFLEKREGMRKYYGGLWQYLHIDEYQDTNRVQYKIAKYLTDGQVLAGAARPNICAVGDADQNIYGWRGATIENILNFEKDYPDATVITLEKNYRSTKIILSAANDIIKKNILRKDKTLYTDNIEGEKISLLVSYTENDEARAIADTAKRLIASGISPGEIAVLYRANFQSRALEEAFIKKNIPYQLIGTRFFERKEVKDVLSYVRAALNHDGSLRSDISILKSDRSEPAGEPSESWGDIARIINVPPRGIGKATVIKLASGVTDLPPAMKEKVAGFWKLLGDIKKEIMEKKPSEAVKFIIEETGMSRVFQKGDIDDEERLRNIQELVSVATQYDDLPAAGAFAHAGTVQTAQDGASGIEKFLENAALATDQDELEKNEDAVKLMTVHASKGLEFDAVFVAGLEQDLFPFKRADEKEVSRADEEEERRLFYVALTRAKKKVFLSYAIVRNIYGAQRVSAPSEFIDDIAKESLEEHVPEKPTGAKAIFIDF